MKYLRRASKKTENSLLTGETAPAGRSRFLLAFVTFCFLLLVARVAYVQVIGNDFFLHQGAARYARTLTLPASRGNILDRNGLILASSVPAASIWAVPDSVDKTSPEGLAALTKLAKLIQEPMPRLLQQLNKENKDFVWVKRLLDWDVGQKIAALKINGIYIRKEYKRRYPEGIAAAHIVGFTNIEDEGQEGIEIAYNDSLKGKAGSRRVIRNRLGQVIEEVGDAVPAVNGSDVQLSIDSKIQYFAYQKLAEHVEANKAKAGSVVVLDAHTGEILALANYPSYDPADRRNLTGEQLRNRALTDVFEPGSVMKPFTISMALEAGVVTPTTQIDTTPGYIYVNGAKLSDVKNYGLLTVEGVIVKSSNVGATKISQKMTAEYMWNVFSMVGFGERPQIKFPGVSSGRLRPWRTWRTVEQATMSYGYGISANLLQMARAYTIFANKGVLMPVSLVKRQEPPVGVQVFSEKTAAEVKKMLKMAAAPGSSGQRAQAEGYTVGGKSGTARKQKTNERGYMAHKYRSWYVGLAPIENPRIIVATMIDEPSAGKYYGGAVAAPVFSQVVQQALRLLGETPDKDLKPKIIATGAEEEEVIQ